MGNRPIRGQVYTLAQIEELDLDDSPFLMLPGPGDLTYPCNPVQTSHLKGGLSEGTDNPVAMGLLEFRYERTTSEWCPIFRALDSFEVLKNHFKYEVEFSRIKGDNDFWITPKLLPQEQYYCWDPRRPGRIIARHGGADELSYEVTQRTLDLIRRFPEYAPK